MLPLCQLRCAEISTLPASLSEFTLICVFVAMTGDEVISSEGERWVVRTYESLEDLVPIAYPGDASWIRSYPITWEILKKDTPPDLSCVPEEHWIDFGRFWTGQALYPCTQQSRWLSVRQLARKDWKAVDGTNAGEVCFSKPLSTANSPGCAVLEERFSSLFL